jgi:hypothetical protein
MIISFIRYDWKEAETVLQENVYTFYLISKDDVKINNIQLRPSEEVNIQNCQPH